MFAPKINDAGASGLGESLSPEEKKLDLFRRQKTLLDTFLSTGAISRAQYNKSLNSLIEKTGIGNGR